MKTIDAGKLARIKPGIVPVGERGGSWVPQENIPIGCEGATYSICIHLAGYGSWIYRIDDNPTLATSFTSALSYGFTALREYLQLYGCDAAEEGEIGNKYVRIFNNSADYHRIHIQLDDGNAAPVADSNDNPTLFPDAGSSGVFEACLAPD